jgi:Thrombospondin type 3 repeat
MTHEGGNFMTCNTTRFRGALAPGTLISNLRQHGEVPIRRKRLAISMLGSFAIAAGLLFPIDADAEVVDFRFLGDLNQPSLTIGSLTVTGSPGNVFVTPGFGVGIGSFAIEPGETVIFTFANPASNVRITGCSGSTSKTLTAVNASGASQTVSLPDGANCVDISGAFNFDPLSRVELTNLGQPCVNCLIIIGAIEFNFDRDDDSVPDADDNCPAVANSNQADNDSDDLGDACDADDDNDTVEDADDNCPLDPNPDQADSDGDGDGDVCDTTNADLDNDGVQDDADMCVPTPAGQVVNAEGCSIAQICPCDGPWKNQGAYVSCTANTAEEFLDLGLITGADKDAIVSAAGKSKCGKKK